MGIQKGFIDFIFNYGSVIMVNTSAIVFYIQFQLVFQDNGTCDANSLRHFVMYTAVRTLDY